LSCNVGGRNAVSATIWSDCCATRAKVGAQVLHAIVCQETLRQDYLEMRRVRALVLYSVRKHVRQVFPECV
jgi:hypothetical protein